MPPVTVVETPAYLSRALKIMSQAERDEVVDLIAREPLGGVLIKGGGGLRKRRFGLEGRGKRGGSRVDLLVSFCQLPSRAALGLCQE